MLPSINLIPTVAQYCKNDVAGALMGAISQERLCFEYSLSALLFAVLHYKQQNVKAIPDSVVFTLRHLEHQTNKKDLLYPFIEITAYLLHSMGN